MEDKLYELLYILETFDKLVFNGIDNLVSSWAGSWLLTAYLSPHICILSEYIHESVLHYTR